ncbi:MAG: 4a-hydroxytetrahydrobiopterin dehydratase [Myxococcales bacterium]|nr:4a-hydroxytetrahydrobiopterin dehydratase [Myxococcales bacterium]MCB9519279.1 4a-hydroxytetrahydrobiopterin dehydratase [Myxococcales bacterium]MCB9530723.1 4a-hydroxytetrahydrobiopterin dehydratase [Myxococcales bacterium]MCB9533383.1 4a-hydroxytetrahydrobiopterin dehydratase [Myxococcales bacterium]
MRQRLDEAEIATRLTTVPGWRRDGETLVREWQLGDFDVAMALINAVADVARTLDHHPDLYNVYNRVRLSVTTHDAGGLTALDFEFAARVSAIAAE